MIVKICGITSPDDAALVLDAGADWVGLNFVAGPRRVNLTIAEAILSACPAPERMVALIDVRNGHPDAAIMALLRRHGVTRVQLYGDVCPATFSRLHDEGYQTIHVAHIGGESTLRALDEFLATCGDQAPDYLLFDTKVPGKLGGTGAVADWDLIAADLRRGDVTRPPIILAGGLGPNNVGDAIARVLPSGVDVCSGVEARVGRKDAAKVAAFVEAVRRLEHP